MPGKIVMPRLGWTMEEGTLVAWRKQDGDPVEAGEILFEVETEKALNEVPSFETGVLRIPPDAPALGATVPVGTLLAWVVAPGESAPVVTYPPSPPPHGGRGSGDTSNLPFPRGEGGQGGVGHTRRHGEVTISPRALRIAAELGVDWRRLDAGGRTGRLRERDIRAAAEQGAEAAPALPDRAGPVAIRAPAAPPAPRPADEVRPITPARRRIAERLTEAARVADVTLMTEADAAEVVALHDRLKGSLAPRGLAAPTYTDLMAKLTASALEGHPLLNASWQEDGIHLYRDIHLGIAVDTDAGLIVPVIRDLSDKSLRQIAAEAAALAEKARSRRLTPEEQEGGTFTITNLGAYGIDGFTPLLNLPQCAILGVGRIHRKPAVHIDQVVPRPMMALSLTFDHRVVDGGPAARFLGTVREFVEDPYLWLTG